MRWHLLTTFDNIYVHDLHGNSNEERDCATDGSPDMRMFLIFVKALPLIVGAKTRSGISSARARKQDRSIRFGEFWGDERSQVQATLELGELKNSASICHLLNITQPEVKALSV
jgi:hypothetical protein